MSKSFGVGDRVLVINCHDEHFNEVFTVTDKREHSYGKKPLIVAHSLGDESVKKLFHAWELQTWLSNRPRDLTGPCDHTFCCLTPR